MAMGGKRSSAGDLAEIRNQLGLPPAAQERRDLFEDQVLLIESLGAGAASKVNSWFYTLLEFLRGLLLPKLNGFERQQAMVYLLNVLASPWTQCLLAKFLYVQYQFKSFLLMLSIASLLPFLVSFRNLVLFIPCPPMASLVSNGAIVVVLAIMLIFSSSMFGVSFNAYVFCFTVWPLLPISSMVARQYINRDKTLNQFSPITKLPFLALMGVGTQLCMLTALKQLTLTDMLVVSSLDSAISAVCGLLVFRFDRLPVHFAFVKFYMVQIALVCAYYLGEQRPPAEIDSVEETDPLYFMRLQMVPWAILGRFLCILRSIYIKNNFAVFNAAEPVIEHLETWDALFQTAEAPRKHRFKKFPGPVLLTLDVIFDSGLCDTELHGVGPLGTHDIFVLTDFTYMLPLISLASWTTEWADLPYGFMPQGHQRVDEIQDATLDGDGEYAEIVTTGGFITICVVVVLYCFSYVLQPWSTSKYLFNRGSSVHTWKNRPLLMVIIPFLCDVLWLNVTISKWQILVCIAIGLANLEYRSGLWTRFKRKYLLLLTKELHYHMPSTLRGLQKRTMLEFLHQTSTDDYQLLLLETCIHHGNNIRSFARDTAIKVWDPRPSATAAWKLATSIVMKAVRQERLTAKERKNHKLFMHQFIRDLIIECADAAVVSAEGHGTRLKLADIHARQSDKLRAIRKLRKLVTDRKARRHAKQTYLSTAPVILAATGGSLRAVGDVTHPKFKHKNAQQAALSNDQAPSGNAMVPPGMQLVPVGQAPPTQLPPPQVPRGLKTLGLPSIEDGHLPGILSVILGFGAESQGQLGVLSSTGLKQHVMPIDELRSRDFVQVECGGCASFFTTSTGKVLGTGSNRSLELGFRMDIVQAETPAAVKTLRTNNIVQMAASHASIGQAHSLALAADGGVLAFGTSSCGALGLEHVTQSLPEPIRLTYTVPMIQVACGARHSAFLAETGEVYATGDNRHGQLGVPEFKGFTGVLQKVENIPKMRLIACGDTHTLGVVATGGVYSWGGNSSGQCGINSTLDAFTPKQIHFPLVPKQEAPFKLVSISAGAMHTLVSVMCNKQAYVFGFGSNVDGQLGLGPRLDNDDTHRLEPFTISGLCGNPARCCVQVAAAGNHTLALMKTGEVYAFGSNRFGQLGYLPPGARDKLSAKVQLHSLDGVPNFWDPTRIHALRVHHVRYIATSDRHSMVIAA